MDLRGTEMREFMRSFTILVFGVKSGERGPNQKRWAPFLVGRRVEFAVSCISKWAILSSKVFVEYENSQI